MERKGRLILYVVTLFAILLMGAFGCGGGKKNQAVEPAPPLPGPVEPPGSDGDGSSGSVLPGEEGDGSESGADPVPPTDTDNDGIPDSVEGTQDTDLDGTPDNQDTDSDGDGIPDGSEAGADPSQPTDTDGDGTPNYQDTDSDGDGVLDANEGTSDADGDGIPDSLEKDADADGAEDATDNCPRNSNGDQQDNDGDGIGNTCDNCPDVANPPVEGIQLNVCQEPPMGQPLSGLQLEFLTQGSGRPTNQVTDNGDGTYTADLFDFTDPGNGTIWVETKGNTSARMPVAVTAGSPANIEISLTQETVYEDIVSDGVADDTIRAFAFITDAQGHPLSNLNNINFVVSNAGSDTDTFNANEIVQGIYTALIPFEANSFDADQTFDVRALAGALPSRRLSINTTARLQNPAIDCGRGRIELPRGSRIPGQTFTVPFFASGSK